jgi:hypothetical protein
MQIEWKSNQTAIRRKDDTTKQQNDVTIEQRNGKTA